MSEKEIINRDKARVKYRAKLKKHNDKIQAQIEILERRIEKLRDKKRY